ncbi:MAG: DNA topoisomerase VI subunit B [Phycisphaerae bacterium]|nr:DNA topoisomerase VI subunit B [Phycisphaerae bacterium]
MKRAPKPKPAAAKTRPGRTRGLSAEDMARQQREISVSEFFAKNRHLLGFDNKRKAMLTTVKEAVDNSLDACEEAGILPDIWIEVSQLTEDRFCVCVRDNGPGIVKQQIPNIFGKLLYGSKFHRLKMARGQQGIGISAAGMYGLLTTGKPISIISRIAGKKDAHHYKLAIDTKKNKPDIIHDDAVEVDWEHGTRVEIELEASYAKGRQSVDEYVEQTAIANPHGSFAYQLPTGEVREYPRSVHELPPAPREIKPHPYGIELGTLMKMLKETECQQVGAFLQTEFSRVSPTISRSVCDTAGLTPRTWVKTVDPQTAEKLFNALQKTRIMAPATNCLAPIGAEAILAGLLKGIKAEFYTATTRPPAVYRGNPFQIEVGIAYGGELGGDWLRSDKSNGDASAPPETRVLRFANRVPLLYQQSGCSMYRSVVETGWNKYGLSQSRGSLPAAPMVVLVHMASVWVPFTSESKEAIADYDEIRKEIKLAIAECGRRLGVLLRRKRTKVAYARRRDVFTRYIDEVVNAVGEMTRVNRTEFRGHLLKLSERYTAAADMDFDDHGKVIRKSAEPGLADTVVVDRSDDGEPDEPEQGVLFEDEAPPPPTRKPARPRRKK